MVNLPQVSLIGTECLSHESAPSRPTRSRKCFHYFYVDQVQMVCYENHTKWPKNASSNRRSLRYDVSDVQQLHFCFLIQPNTTVSLQLT